MHRIVIYCFFLVLFFFSCSPSFLDTSPTDQLPSVDALSTQENVCAALNGIYRQFVAAYLGNQSCGGEPSMCIFRDCLGEDVVYPATGSGFYIGSVRWQDHRNESSDITAFPFSFYYYLILQSNLLLESVSSVPVVDTTLSMDRVRGECYGLRGWSHFQLVQLYGKRYVNGIENLQPGVPYRLSSSFTPLERSSVEDCYRLIHEDLDSAAVCLSRVPSYSQNGTGVTHLSLKVIYGLKARVYLAQQVYALGSFYSDLAISLSESEGCRLMSGDECLNGFSMITEKTSEVLWASCTRSDESIGFYSFYAYMSWNFNSTAIRLAPRCINRLLYDALSLGDVRRGWWDASGKSGVPSSSYKQFAYQSRKFSVENTSISSGDFSYMRLSELYLMKAECLARQGDEDGARFVLYSFMKHRDASYELSLNSGSSLLDEILFHRRVELWGEGFRFTDLKRLDLALDREGGNHVKSVCSVLQVESGDVRWQWLLPEGEVNAAMGIVEQNE